MSMELKYQILLQMKKNVSMQPDKIDGDPESNERAILELKDEGLVSIIGSEFGNIIVFTLTDKGVIKQTRLIQDISESKLSKFSRCGVKGIKFLSLHLIKIVVGVAITVIGGLLLAYFQN